MNTLYKPIHRQALGGALLVSAILLAACGGSDPAADPSVAASSDPLASAQARKTPRGNDKIAPSAPQGLTATAASSSSVSLSWTAATDNVAVTGYRVYRCTGASCTPDSLVGSASTTSYADGGLSATTAYTYQVAALDAAGNVSAPSPTATATTASTTTPPPPPPPGSADACPMTDGRTLEVGPGKTYATPSAAASAAQAGDRILIAPGDYVGDVAIWYAGNLTICGDGGRARLFANGKNAAGKGIWVMYVPNSATTTILNVEFHDARVPDKNGAGIRLDGGSLVLRNTGFYDNENGILGGNGGTTVTIERSEFARNGYGNGYSHNIYIVAVDRLAVKASYFHEAKIGHNLKSRAKETVIENSYFADRATGTSSYLIDTPNGGVVFMRGNLLHKGPKADNAIAVSYGAEGLSWTTNTLTMVHNTVVSTYPGGAFMWASSGTQQIRLTANLYAGTNNPGFLWGGIDPAKVSQQSNLVTTADNVPGATDLNFWLVSTLLPQLQLGQVLDPQYVADSPQLYTLRTITATGRMIGALQSQP